MKHLFEYLLIFFLLYGCVSTKGDLSPTTIGNNNLTIIAPNNSSNYSQTVIDNKINLYNQVTNQLEVELTQFSKKEKELKNEFNSKNISKKYFEKENQKIQKQKKYKTEQLKRIENIKEQWLNLNKEDKKINKLQGTSRFQEFENSPNVVLNQFNGVTVIPILTNFNISGEPKEFSNNRKSSWTKFKKEKDLSCFYIRYHLTNYNDFPLTNLKLNINWKLPTYRYDYPNLKISPKINIFSANYYQKKLPNNTGEPFEWALARLSKDIVNISSIGPNETIEIPLTRITSNKLSNKPTLFLKFKDNKGIQWIKNDSQKATRMEE